MATQQRAFECRLLGVSVTGAGHARRGEACQDALAWHAAGMPFCLAVADGHGSPSSFRSGAGARIAVQTAVDVMQRFLRSVADGPLSMIKHSAADQLPRAIVRSWREQVRSHHEREPFTEAELGPLDAGAAKKAQENPLHAYGSTLLVAGVSAAAITYLHLGDGDILSVSATGEVARPIAQDDRSFADETASLCLREAWRDFRVGFQATAHGTPALILLATDGYANCFATDEDFRKVGPDLLAAALRASGPEQVQEQLGKELPEASQRFSGDDITLGMIWFPQATPEHASADGIAISQV